VCVCASGLTCFAAAASTRAAVAARRRRRRCLAVRQQQRRNRWRTVGPEIGIGDAIRWSLHTFLGYFRHSAALKINTVLKASNNYKECFLLFCFYTKPQNINY